MTKTKLSRCRNALVALTLALGTLSTGCAVGTGEPGEETAYDESAIAIDEARDVVTERDALLEQLADDVHADQVTDRERALLEIIERVHAGEDLDALHERVVDSARQRPGVDEEALDEIDLEHPGGPVTG